MTAFPAARSDHRELLSRVNFRDFDVSWVGASLQPGIFCFGSEDGRILLADWRGKVIHAPVHSGPSKEAINGVAFLEGWMCASTRNEVMIRQGDSTLGAVLPMGAHGVIAGHNGYFLAPLGCAGLLFCRPKVGHEQTVTVSNGRTEDAYFYRLISLQASGEKEIVACATRRGGVAAMEFGGEDQKHTLSTITFDGLDVVDLCPLGMQAVPEGAAALGKDGKLILFRDVLRDRQPLALNFESVKGTAYRILSARGHLFLLTSEALYVFSELVTRFANAEPSSQVTPALVVPMGAVDAGLGNDQWLWIVLPDGVLRFDIEFLGQITPSNLRYGEQRDLLPTEISPNWHEQRIEHSSRAMAVAA